MKVFNYELTTTYGSATGTAEAESEKSLKSTLTKQYQGNLVEVDDNEIINTVKNKIESIVITEVEEENGDEN